MNELKLEAYIIVIASVLSFIYIWSPGPYPMGAFTFIAQPLFAVAMGSYAWKVLKDLRKK
jgi:hypothetical protein